MQGSDVACASLHRPLSAEQFRVELVHDCSRRSVARYLSDVYLRSEDRAERRSERNFQASLQQFSENIAEMTATIAETNHRLSDLVDRL